MKTFRLPKIPKLRRRQIQAQVRLLDVILSATSLVCQQRGVAFDDGVMAGIARDAEMAEQRFRDICLGARHPTVDEAVAILSALECKLGFYAVNVADWPQHRDALISPQPMGQRLVMEYDDTRVAEQQAYLEAVETGTLTQEQEITKLARDAARRVGIDIRQYEPADFLDRTKGIPELPELGNGYSTPDDPRRFVVTFRHREVQGSNLEVWLGVDDREPGVFKFLGAEVHLRYISDADPDKTWGYLS